MQTLAGEEEGDDSEVSESEEKFSREAVIAASQMEGGTMHVDDNYVPLENNPGPRYPPTHSGQDLDVLQYGDYPTDQGSHTSKRLRNQDTIVPVNLVQMSMCVPPASPERDPRPTQPYRPCQPCQGFVALPPVLNLRTRPILVIFC